MPGRAGRSPHDSTGGAATLAQGPGARPLLLDGATGTELERRGVDCDLPLWSARALLEAPETVEAVHRDYVAAGVDCVTANTFRTQAHVLRRAGLESRARELSGLAIALARRATQDRPDVRVAGSAAPLEDCYRPDCVPPPATLEREHAQHCEALAGGGADWILVETMGTVREARAATAAATSTGLPVLVSLIGAASGPRLLSGEPAEAAIEALVPLAPAALLVNCVPVGPLDSWLPVLRDSGLPFGVSPNLGAPGADPAAARSDHLSPRAFAALATRWVAAGAQLVGGCCGTQPAHLSAVNAVLRGGASAPEK